MDIFGIGASELVFIILIAIIVLGPKDMQKAGRTIGRFLNQLMRSEGWKIFQRTSNELRNLPRNLMREANMEMMEAEKDLRRVIDPRTNPPASRSSSASSVPPSNEAENLPPVDPVKPTENNSDENA
jgi:sec-independent protein translocase protein TatB